MFIIEFLKVCNHYMSTKNCDVHDEVEDIFEYTLELKIIWTLNSANQ